MLIFFRWHFEKTQSVTEVPKVLGRVPIGTTGETGVPVGQSSGKQQTYRAARYQQLLLAFSHKNRGGAEDDPQSGPRPI